jgi:SAM-dependent methyltransferase
LFGGSLAGRRVLDLGCNAGFFSLKAVEAGAEFVLGIDGRQIHVDQAELVFDAYGVERHRYQFACANFMNFPLEEQPPFDLVLCLGVLYHVSKPVELLERISGVNSDVLIIDTRLSRLHGALLEVRHEGVDRLLNAVDDELVMVPTSRAVEMFARHVGYKTGLLSPVEGDGAWGKYRGGAFGTFLCAKTSDLSSFSFQTEKQLRRAQRKGKGISPEPRHRRARPASERLGRRARRLRKQLRKQLRRDTVRIARSVRYRLRRR